MQMAERRERVAKWQAERRGDGAGGASTGDASGSAAVTNAASGETKGLPAGTDDADADDEAGPGEAQDLGDSELTLADENTLMAQEGAVRLASTIR